MEDYGKIHVDVFEEKSNTSNQIWNTWKISNNDNRFKIYDFRNNRGNVTISNTSGNIILELSGTDEWNDNDKNKLFKGNGGSAIIIEPLSVKKKAIAQVRTMFLNTNVITEWNLCIGEFVNDSFQIISKKFESLYYINSLTKIQPVYHTLRGENANTEYAFHVPYNNNNISTGYNTQLTTAAPFYNSVKYVLDIDFAVDEDLGNIYYAGLLNIGITSTFSKGYRSLFFIQKNNYKNIHKTLKEQN